MLLLLLLLLLLPVKDSPFGRTRAQVRGPGRELWLWAGRRGRGGRAGFMSTRPGRVGTSEEPRRGTEAGTTTVERGHGSGRRTEASSATPVTMAGTRAAKGGLVGSRGLTLVVSWSNAGGSGSLVECGGIGLEHTYLPIWTRASRCLIGSSPLGRGVASSGP